MIRSDILAKSLSVLTSLILLLLFVGSSQAQTITVNTINDDVVASDDLCTLREAMTNALSNSDTTLGDCVAGGPGPETIVFNVPGVFDPVQINLGSALPTITSALTIDGETQPNSWCGGQIPDRNLQIVLNGASIGGAADGLTIATDNSTIRGVVVKQFQGIGIHIVGGNSNTIECSYVGTDWTGSGGRGNSANGISISGTSTGNMIGGASDDAGNLISDNGADGVHFEPGASGNFVYGNYIGTDRWANGAMGNAAVGVGNNQGDNNRIGGPGAGEGNVISGNGIYGIESVGAAAVGMVIQGNKIGTDRSGTVPIPNGTGILVAAGATLHQIGGFAAGEGNTIAFNFNDGIRILGATTSGIWIRGNNIYENGDLGIDLNDDGVTPNDADDPDTGPNNLQNWPDVQEARIDLAGDLHVTLAPTSLPGNSLYPLLMGIYQADVDLEEGGRFLDTYLETSYPNVAAVNFGPAANYGLSGGDWLIVDAEDSLANHSEFSPAVQIWADVPQSHKDALIALYNDTDGPNWRNNTNWITDPDVSNWYGVTVEAEGITGIDLANNKLVGTLPSKLGDLEFLTGLQVAGNVLTGTLPLEIENLQNLQFLHIDGNQFSGPLPAWLGNMGNLVEFTASDNLFNGSIPPAIFGIPGLQVLQLANNFLSGDVLTTFAPLENLTELWLQGNNLTSLPNFSTLPALAGLQVQGNRFVMSDLEPNANVPGFVYAPQQIFGTPFSSVVALGGDIELATSPAGGADTQYQWYLGSAEVSGATSEVLSISKASFSDAGSYTLKAINPNLPDLTLTSEIIDLFVSALVVNTVIDEFDSGDESCTLREAIMTANANEDITQGDCMPKGGFDTISFNLPGAGPHVISLSLPLPDITEAVLIDGYSQPGAMPNTLGFDQGSNAVIMIELDGFVTPSGTNGFTIQTSGVQIRGLALTRFPSDGVRIESGSPFEEFEATFTVSNQAGTLSTDLILGLSPTASDGFDGSEDVAAPPAPPEEAFDARFTSGAGDLTSDFRNSSDINHTWTIDFDVATGLAVVSWDPSAFPAFGALRLRDTADGLDVNVDMREVSSLVVPDIVTGLEISYESPTPGSRNQIEGMFIGMDVTGTIARGNGGGISIAGGFGNIIGGSFLDDVNFIGGNTSFGLSLEADTYENTEMAWVSRTG